MSFISRRSFVKGLSATSVLAGLSSTAIRQGRSQKPVVPKFSQAGWCWDGQGFNGGVNPSIFGAGEGTKWFGLKKTAFMFHPNTELALEKLNGFDEVICEISKWKVRRCENGVAHYLDGRLETKRQEAATVGKLSRRYSNVTGAIDDDLLGIIRREKITPRQYGRVYQALKQENDDLKLWIVVYDRELEPDYWAGFQPFADVVNLCVSNQTENFSHLGEFLDKSQRIFPGKPVNLIYRLRDFGAQPLGPVPMDLLERHWNDILKYVEQGRLSGYSILGGFLIDMHPQQARWLRGFIADQ